MKFLAIPTLKCAKCFIDLFSRVENDQLVFKHLFISDCELKGKTFVVAANTFEIELDVKEISVSKNKF